MASSWGHGGPLVLPGYLEHDVAVGLVELAVESLVHQCRHEVLNLPDAEAGQLPHVLTEELRVVQLRLLQALVPAACLQVRCFRLPALLWGQGHVTKLVTTGFLPAPGVGQGHAVLLGAPLPPQTLPLSSCSSPGPRPTCPSAPAWPGHPGQSPCAAGAASCGPAGPWCRSLGTRGQGERQLGHPCLAWGMLWGTVHFPASPRVLPKAEAIIPHVPACLPAAAAATVAGEAPARRSWFCREKSMLYHSDVRSTGFGGITRLGFSRTSRICQGGDGRPHCSEAWTHGDAEDVGWDGRPPVHPGLW